MATRVDENGDELYDLESCEAEYASMVAVEEELGLPHHEGLDEWISMARSLHAEKIELGEEPVWTADDWGDEPEGGWFAS